MIEFQNHSPSKSSNDREDSHNVPNGVSCSSHHLESINAWLLQTQEELKVERAKAQEMADKVKKVEVQLEEVPLLKAQVRQTQKKHVTKFGPVLLILVFRSKFTRRTLMRRDRPEKRLPAKRLTWWKRSGGSRPLAPSQQRHTRPQALLLPGIIWMR